MTSTFLSRVFDLGRRWVIYSLLSFRYVTPCSGAALLKTFLVCPEFKKFLHLRLFFELTDGAIV